ncbi:MAG: iron-sulfur cluster biosynthesis family protein, partial [Marinoscillum sp.]
MNVPIQITDKARKEIKDIMTNKNIPAGYGLRVGVKGGGCGVSFVLGFDKQKDQDQAYLIDDIPIYIQKREMMFLV